MSNNEATPGSASSRDHAFERAQAAYLDRCAPGHRTRRVRWSGGTTQIIELGEGPPLLLLHGGLGEAIQWANILPALARKHRVMAVDRPGHGLADPFDYGEVDLLACARRFLGELLDAEGLASVPIVAASMGGLWSLDFALTHPQRVPRLVLTGAPAGVTRTLPLQMRLGTLPVLKTLVRSMMRQPTRDSTRAFWKQLLVAHPERLSDDLVDLLTESQRRNAPSWFTLIDRAFDVRGMKKGLLLTGRWKDLPVPTTLVWGERDAWGGPALGEAIASMNPRVRMVRIPDAGHAVWMDAPELVVEAIEGALSGEEFVHSLTARRASPS
ncbi:pimeloyl-ACP methyl ester carboxylesterase [Archangium gephyra]|uniref:2-hydroxymuconic semialdehyde hydrolase n=2 Tax=Archangium gephyra TaxID=48 RepID=A0AAC8TCD3_9BACT|nr:2-hydroxymuconic semialdehyde hydrolase [Archangium gephyra]REG20746.1 pimeloyl-ACP methyl ester carboxylesterase [Archangium gephyra]